MKLILSPNEWLQKSVEPFNFEKFDPTDLGSRMIETMEQNKGIGLAANQVGIDAQIFVMKTYNLGKPEPIIVINPRIELTSSDSVSGLEGCLSHPELFLKIRRPSKVLVNFLDTQQNECTLTLEGIDARCFLHEYDHLHGIEFIDRASKLKLEMARKKIQKKRKKQYG